jgi:hypothetical protein
LLLQNFLVVDLQVECYQLLVILLNKMNLPQNLQHRQHYFDHLYHLQQM